MNVKLQKQKKEKNLNKTRKLSKFLVVLDFWWTKKMKPLFQTEWSFWLKICSLIKILDGKKQKISMKVAQKQNNKSKEKSKKRLIKKKKYKLSMKIVVEGSVENMKLIFMTTLTTRKIFSGLWMVMKSLQCLKIMYLLCTKVTSMTCLSIILIIKLKWFGWMSWSCILFLSMVK